MPANLHPLPANPTTGQQPMTTLGSSRIGGAPPASAAGGGGVNRETLKGLQDVVWSDDEDDPDCILCAEPLDLSDLNFKPCQCGMQICQFCYNKLLSTDPRCPGCRRPYDAKAVVFQPVDWEEVKKAKEKKTRRAKTIKQLDAIGRRHLLGVRIVMKNTVYVVGMKLPAPPDESISILRSNDYFGQYGKISKLQLRDRTTLSSTSVHTLAPDNPSTAFGIYIVYVRREDAARAISALDGIAAPQGPPGTTLHATYGTTRYCESFLRGGKCDNNNCLFLHEWGGESDCFTKEDMETALLRPAEYDARLKQAHAAPPNLSSKSAWPKPSADEVVGSTGLPSSANWPKTVGSGRTSRSSTNASQGVRPGKVAPLAKANAALPLSVPPPINGPKEKRKTAIAMGRGRSSDSTQSATTSSNQASPKKKTVTLPTASKTAQRVEPPVGPPPGLAESATAERATEEADVLTDSLSTESEAGPSTASPAPQTPGRTGEQLPPPLTADPIFLHSPYEEPQLPYFPASDPAFAFYLGMDESEVRQYQEAIAYQPSPFDKTLIGLAELGVLAPELPRLSRTPPGMGGWTGSFQPFEADRLDFGDPEAGPSRPSEETQDGPRTTSRFDFARPSSGLARPSPFTMRRADEARGNGWIGQQLTGDSTGRIPSFSSGPFDNGDTTWSNGDLVGPGSAANHNGGYSTTPVRPRGQEQAARYHTKTPRDDEYDHYSPYSANAGPPSASRNRNVFAPAQEDEGYHSPAHPFHARANGGGGGGGAYPDARTLQHYHQMRANSPTPMGYRRY